MHRVLVTGGNGQLGRSLKRIVREKNIQGFTFTDIDILDITSQDDVEKFLADSDFTHIINCAAYTAVDKAETDVETAFNINVTGVKNLAEASAKRNIKLMHISTDYVYDGKTSKPYKESDPAKPETTYGRTKLEGEKVLFEIHPNSIVIRTAWLYSEYGKNFVFTMLALSDKNKDINVVNDQFGSPTYAHDLAGAILDIVMLKEWVPGIYNYTNEGYATWFDLARSVFINAGKDDVKVNPISSSEYPTPAKRPHYSVLCKNKIKNQFRISIPHWETSLRECLYRIEKLVN